GGLLAVGAVWFQISYATGLGGNNVVLTRVSSGAPVITSLSLLANGSVKIQATAQSGLTYGLESASNLSSPTFSPPVGRNTATNGVFQFTDTSPPALTSRYYRIRWP